MSPPNGYLFPGTKDEAAAMLDACLEQATAPWSTSCLSSPLRRLASVLST